MTAMTEKEKVMKRVAKLLNLANGNQNEHEAQAALLKAQEMMAQNSISLSDLDVLKPDQKKEVAHVGTQLKKHQWYHKALARLIADNFRCYYYLNVWKGSSIVFMGLKADAELAKTMYEFAVLAIEYNADEYIKEQRKVRYIRDATGIKTDYMHGFINGLSAKFKEQAKTKVTQNIVDEASGMITGTKEVSMALVLVKDDALVKAHEDMKFRKGAGSKGGNNRAGDAEAFQAGREKGKSFEAASGYIGN